MLSIEVRHLIMDFARGDGYLAHPEGCENMCGTISYVFIERATKHGIEMQWARCHKALDITRQDTKRLSSWHIVPVYDGYAIDFTARQFWPTTEWPMIAPVHEYALRFAQMTIYAREMMGECSGPSRIGRRDRFKRQQQS